MVDAGEGPEEAAIRELKEETGGGVYAFVYVCVCLCPGERVRGIARYILDMSVELAAPISPSPCVHCLF
jgi:ADP-ribose pyrophosphatase YjhB (NUDIX family)